MDTMDGLAGITSDNDIGMKQFKAEWQPGTPVEPAYILTIDHLITQHNALCDYLEEQEGETTPKVRFKPCVIKVPKPEWWKNTPTNHALRISYHEALEAASKASGILFTLED